MSGSAQRVTTTTVLSPQRRTRTRTQNANTLTRGWLVDVPRSYINLDLASFDSIKRFAAEFKATDLPCHVLLANAGVMFCPFARTKEGFEMQWGVNHLGHALLVRLLLPHLRQTNGRVVLVSSVGHVGVRRADYRRVGNPESFRTMHAYGVSKLANVLYARALQKWLHSNGDQIVVVSLHPGAVNTELM